MSRVLHLIDSLAAGGAETVCVNLVNELDVRGIPVALCSTRSSGPLEARLRSGIPFLNLSKRWLADVPALARLYRFCRTQNVTLLHAHSSSVFSSALIAALMPQAVLLWHDHYGDLTENARSPLPYWLIRGRVAHAIAANEELLAWQRFAAGFAVQQSSYFPNFSVWPSDAIPAAGLPGVHDRRVVCVANFRPQKDHRTLLDAFAQVRRAVSDAHLLLVGAAPERSSSVRARANDPNLRGHVHFLGERADVPSILLGSAVGVLASRSEGLPLSLVEYGHAGLLAVATDVGQCAEVLDGGRAGLMVPAGSPGALARALVQALTNADLRASLGLRLQQRVRTHFGSERYLLRLCQLYADLGFLPATIRPSKPFDRAD